MKGQPDGAAHREALNIYPQCDRRRGGTPGLNRRVSAAFQPYLNSTQACENACYRKMRFPTGLVRSDARALHLPVPAQTRRCRFSKAAR